MPAGSPHLTTYHCAPCDADHTHVPEPPPRDRCAHILADEYELLEPIARGRRCDVYSVKDSRRPADKLCVKLLRESCAACPRQRARFINASAVLPRIAHPNVVRVRDAGRAPLVAPDGSTVGEFDYVVMDQVGEGESLARLFLSPNAVLQAHELLEVSLGMSRAVAQLHAAGLVHLDISGSDFVIVRDSERRLERVVMVDPGYLVPRTSFDVPPGCTLLRPVPADQAASSKAPEVMEGRRGRRCTDVYTSGQYFRDELKSRLVPSRPSSPTIVDAETWARLEYAKLDLAMCNPDTSHRPSTPSVSAELMRIRSEYEKRQQPTPELPIRSQLDHVAQLRRAGAAADLADEAEQLTSDTHQDVVFAYASALTGLTEYKAAAASWRLYHRILGNARTPRWYKATEQLALCLGRLATPSDLHEAQTLLDHALDERSLTAGGGFRRREVIAIRAGLRKRRWLEMWTVDPPRLARGHLPMAELVATIKEYRRSFQLEGGYFPAINVLTLVTILRELDPHRTEDEPIWDAEGWEEQWEYCREALEWALREADDIDDPDDHYWRGATKLEADVILGATDPGKVKGYAAAVANQKRVEPFMLHATLAQLRFIGSLRINAPLAGAAIKALETALGRL